VPSSAFTSSLRAPPILPRSRIITSFALPIRRLPAVLGGAQSIHANGYDEAVCLPTDQSMLLAIRTEQIAALETNVTNTIDPLGGSYYIESLTNELEEKTWEYIKDDRGYGWDGTGYAGRLVP